MKKFICIMLSICLLVGLMSIFSGCDSNNNSDIEQLTPEEQAMLDSWNDVLELCQSSYSIEKLERFSNIYGDEEGFEELILSSFSQLNEEQVLRVIISAAAIGDENFSSQKILDCVYERLEFSEKTFQEKIDYLYYLKKEYIFTDKIGLYLKFKISNQEFEEWVASNNEEKLYFESGTGFYADESDIEIISPMSRCKEVKYRGDFKVEHSFEVDSQFQSTGYNHSKHFFRNKWYDGGGPYGNERFVDKYLIQPQPWDSDNSNYITIFDTEMLKEFEINDASIILFIE